MATCVDTACTASTFGSPQGQSCSLEPARQAYHTECLPDLLCSSGQWACRFLRRGRSASPSRGASLLRSRGRCCSADTVQPWLLGSSIEAFFGGVSGILRTSVQDVLEVYTSRGVGILRDLRRTPGGGSLKSMREHPGLPPRTGHRDFDRDPGGLCRFSPFSPVASHV